MTSIISSVTNLYSTGSTQKLKIETIESEAETNGVQTTSDDTDVSSKYDTLELSQDYLNYRMQGENTAMSDETNLENSQTGEAMAPPPPKPPQISVATVTTGSTSTEATTDDESAAAIDAGTEETSATSEDAESSKMRPDKPMGSPPPKPVEEAEDSSESENLSSYSDTELKQMVESGAITRAQYMVEMASRAEENSSAESTSSDTSVNEL